MTGHRRDPSRAPTFEHCEARVTLSAQPVGPTVPSRPVELANSGQQELLQLIHHQYGLDGAGQTVVVIDSGIAYDHPALGGFGADQHIVGGWDFTDENDSDPYDDGPAGFHGTHVAGIIGSTDVDRIGIAPAANLVALRVFNDDGQSDFEWIERALSWVHENRQQFAAPITTVNLSIGVTSQHELAAVEKILDDEFAQLIDDGIFISVAAGNGYDRLPASGLSYPASSLFVVPVGSVGTNGELSEFSRRDPRMLAAPGEQIESTITDYLFDFNGVTDDWHAFSGTSQAAPYAAGSAVLVRQAMERAGYEHIDQAAIYDILRQTADWVDSPHSSEQFASINLLAAINHLLGPATEGTGMPNRALPAFDPPAQDLGPVSFERLTPRLQEGQEHWYRLQASDTGRLIAKTQFANRSLVQLDVFNDAGQWLVGESRVAAETTTSWDASSGHTYYLRVLGNSKLSQLMLANLAVSESASVLNIRIPTEADRVSISSGADLVVEVDGMRHPFDVRSNQSVHVHTDSDDVVDVQLDTQSPSVYLRPSLLDAPTHRLRVSGAQRIQVHTNVAAAQLRIYGSTSDEQFVSRDAHVSLSGDTHRLDGSGFATTYVFGGGGQDRADLYGTTEHDIFVAGTDFARLSNSTQLSYVESFERVYAYASSGNDRAFLYGSSGSDSLAAGPEWARLAREGGLVYAEDFDRVYTTAGAGGLDRAYLYGSSGTDHFVGRPEQSTWSGSSFAHYAAGFDRVYAFAAIGDGDEAKLYGTSNDEQFISRESEVGFGGSSLHFSLFGFDRVVADGQGGRDVASLFGNAGNDRLDLVGNEVQFSTNRLRRQLRDFAMIKADAGVNGHDYVVAPAHTCFDAAADTYVYQDMRIRSTRFSWLIKADTTAPETTDTASCQP